MGCRFWARNCFFYFFYTIVCNCYFASKCYIFY